MKNPARLSRPPYASTQIVMPWVEGTAKLVVLRNGIPLTNALSAPAPAGAVHLARVASHLDGGTTETLAWTGVDPDGDALSYSLLYSHDGLQWDMLATSITTNNFAVAVDSLKGSTAARFRVVANDGVLSGEDETDFSISVPDKAPLALITSPQLPPRLRLGGCSCCKAPARTSRMAPCPKCR